MSRCLMCWLVREAKTFASKSFLKMNVRVRVCSAPVWGKTHVVYVEKNDTLLKLLVRLIDLVFSYLCNVSYCKEAPFILEET